METNKENLTVEQAQNLPSGPTPAELLKIAVTQGADLDKLEKLMDLQQRWEANEARKHYSQSMMSFRKDCPTINKSTNGYNYKYATLADTIEQIKHLLTQYGFSYSWTTGHSNGQIEVTCKIMHEKGHCESTSLIAPPMPQTKQQNSMQAMASTITYLERYTLYAILGLTSKEMDDDGTLGNMEAISPDQCVYIDDLINESRSNKQQFLKFAHVSKISDIKQNQYEQLVAILNKKKAELNI